MSHKNINMILIVLMIRQYLKYSLDYIDSIVPNQSMVAEFSTLMLLRNAWCLEIFQIQVEAKISRQNVPS